VIMLFNLRSLQKSDLKIKDFSFLTVSFKFYFFFGLKFFLILALDIWNLVEYSTYFNKEAVYNQFDLQYFLTYVHWDILLFSNLFYTYYSYIFLLSGLVLLAAMIGSIVLALSTTENFQPNFLAPNEKPTHQKNFSGNEIGETSHNGLSVKDFTKPKLKLTWEQILWVLNKYNWRLHMFHFPVLVFVRQHIDEFSNSGRTLLTISEIAKEKMPALVSLETESNSKIPNDAELAKVGYTAVYTDWVYDHRRKQLAKFWYLEDPKDPSKRGLYHEFIRISEPWNLVTSPQVKRKSGLTGKNIHTWFDPFWM